MPLSLEGTRFRADPVLVSLLNGVSVLYDAAAIVLFTSLEKHIDEASPAPSGHGRPRALCARVLLLILVLALFGVHGRLALPPSRVSKDYEIGAMCLSAYLTFALAQFCGLCGFVSLFFFKFMLEHFYVYNLSVDSKVAWKVASRPLPICR